MFLTDTIVQLYLFGNLDCSPLGYSYPGQSPAAKPENDYPCHSVVTKSSETADNPMIPKCNAQVEKIVCDPGGRDAPVADLVNVVTDLGKKAKTSGEMDRKEPIDDFEQSISLEDAYPQYLEKPRDTLFLRKAPEVLRQDQSDVEILKAKIEKWISSDEQHILKQQKKEVFAESRYWKPRNYDKPAGMFKMAKNSLRTIRKFRAQPKQFCSLDNLATPNEALDALVNNPIVDRPLAAKCLSNTWEMMGRRDYMEDVSFIMENEDRILSGVFDGHSGNHKTGLGVATYAKASIELNFDVILKENEGNVHKTMETLFFCIQSKLGTKYYEHCKEAGTTAVVTYIDKKSRLMYVATVGDSEATIYRSINGMMKAIPASRVLNWSSPSEARRAADFYSDEALYRKWTASSEPKHLRTLRDNGGINISRTLGDFNHSGGGGFPLISCEPELTVFPLEEGDVVILASDGVEDYLSKDSVGGVIKSHEFENMAEKIAEYAFHQGQSTDNISVVAIKIPEAGL